jgi:hypothetical protein
VRAPPLSPPAGTTVPSGVFSPWQSLQYMVWLPMALPQGARKALGLAALRPVASITGCQPRWLLVW